MLFIFSYTCSFVQFHFSQKLFLRIDSREKLTRYFCLYIVDDVDLYLINVKLYMWKEKFLYKYDKWKSVYYIKLLSLCVNLCKNRIMTDFLLIVCPIQCPSLLHCESSFILSHICVIWCETALLIYITK